MGKSKDGNVTCFMYTQMRIVGLGLYLAMQRTMVKNRVYFTDHGRHTKDIE